MANSHMMMSNRNTLLPFALLLLLLSVSMSLAGDSLYHQEIKGRRVFFDSDKLPEDYDQGNPFILMIYFGSEYPILDHSGQPHDHGHIVQVIRDGGNGQIDAPNSDGSPGGDDSLAFGNYNHSRIGGHDWPPSMEGKTGLWVNYKLFTSYYPDGVYYLRVWEGDDPETAKYYQDTESYQATTGSSGGSMVRINPTIFYGVQDIWWKFGATREKLKE